MRARQRAAQTLLGTWIVFAVVAAGAHADCPVRPSGPLACPEPAAPLPPPCLDDPPTPVVALRVRVMGESVAGHELAYQLIVENRSPAAAHHVCVRAPLPAGTRFVRAEPEPATREPELLWRLGTLPGGASQTITLLLTPTSGDDVRLCARVQFEHGQCVTTRVVRAAGARLSLRRSGPDKSVLGDEVTFQFHLSNVGETELTNIILTDTLPAGLAHDSGSNILQWDVGTLAPGQCRIAEYRVTVKAAGKLCDKAIAIAAGGVREVLESCVTVIEPKLALAMTGPERRDVNQPATYQITVSNPGPVAVREIFVHNPLPDGMTLVNAGADGQRFLNGIRWQVGVLEPGASRTVEIELRAEAPSKICNRAVATAERGLTAKAEFCTEFSGAAGLGFEVVDTDDPIEIGAETSYVITVRNQGSAPAAHVVVKATVPAALALVRATGPGNFRTDGATITFEPLTLRPGAEARYQLDVRAVRAGEAKLRAELMSDALTSGKPVIEEENTTIYPTLPVSLRKRAKP